MILAFLSEDFGGYPKGVVTLDASGADPVVAHSIATDSPWISASWQRLAQ
jgi:hypothetical protein